MTMTVEKALMCADEFAAIGSSPKILAAEVRRLRAENAMLTGQLAQERKRLDWALDHAAKFSSSCGEYFLRYEKELDDCYISTDSPRATIDELIAAEAAGGSNGN